MLRVPSSARIRYRMLPNKDNQIGAEINQAELEECINSSPAWRVQDLLDR